MPSLKEIIFGKKAKIKKATTQTPEQEQLLKLINQGLTNNEGPLKDIFGAFDPAAFEAGVSKPALQQFQDEILPQLQEKFIAGNQVLGSGMQRAQAKAATDLQSKLAQLMYEAQQQQKQNQMQGVSTALGTKAFENVYQPKRSGALEEFIKGFAGRAGEGVGNQVSSAFSGGGAAGGAGAGAVSGARNAVNTGIIAG